MAVVQRRDPSGRSSFVKIHCDYCVRSVGSNALSEDELRDAVAWAKDAGEDVCPECQRRRGMALAYLQRIARRRW